MTVWMVIFGSILLFFTLCFIYLAHKTTRIIPILFPGTKIAAWSNRKRRYVVIFILAMIIALIALAIELINAMVIVFYLAMLWLSGDLLNLFCGKVFKRRFSPKAVAADAWILTIVVLGTGWYLDHHVWQKNYQITVTKKIDHFRIGMIADVHLGTTFDAEGFKAHLTRIAAQAPDILVVVGDYVDDGTSKAEMIKATQYLGQTPTRKGIFFVEGNHDKAYYGAERRGFSLADLHQELIKNGITILRDEVLKLDDQVYLIGRRDLSWEKEQHGQRLAVAELKQNLDPDKLIIVLDHQPTGFEAQAQAKVDLVLSGHTHGGQLFPFNKVGEWTKVNDLIYGHKQIGESHFIVTSGISNWALKFKTGTKSEFVIIDLQGPSNGHASNLGN